MELKNYITMNALEGYLSCDEDDLRWLLDGESDAHIALGSGSGKNKVQEAVSQLLGSPLAKTALESASKLIILITMSKDCTINDLYDTVSSIHNAAAPSVEVIEGVRERDDVADAIEVTVIAAGFNNQSEENNE